jgi:prepilin-type N-terminal cleavage/methylation domain-containing protein
MFLRITSQNGTNSNLDSVMTSPAKAFAKKRLCKPSFTLVELMVVIAIIGVLAGMILYTLAGAQRDSLTARTQGTIKKINDIVLPRWEEFRYRAVKINVPQAFLVPQMRNGAWHVPISAREGARARMIALRDVMRMELPDRYTDILYPPVMYRVGAYTADNYGPTPDTSNDDIVAPFDREIPGQFQTYRRKMVTEPTGAGALPLTMNPYPATAPVAPVGTLRPSPANQGAELLYEIVSNSTYQGSSALEYFRPSEIGDTDGDGYGEFLDAWGRPIQWIRWPAGYPSPLNDTSTPDPMDPLRTDWRWSNSSGQKPWMLVPLIISAGPDGVFDIVFDFESSTNAPCVNPSPPYGALSYATNVWTGNTDPGSPTGIQRKNGPYYFPDPYFAVSGVSPGAYFDQFGDGDGSLDNISNYELVLQ